MGGGASGVRKGILGSATRFEDFGSYDAAMHKSTAWFNDSNNSNSKDWILGLTSDEKSALKNYTGNGYYSINKNLYKESWDNIPPHIKDKITAMDSAFNKSVLLKGINVTRQCDFKIFGAKSGESMTISQIKDFIKTHGVNNTLENKGYLSFGANNHGAAIDGSGLVIHTKVPPSIGAGAYVNPISVNAGGHENEFLFNRNSNFKFNLNSLRKDSSGKIHIDAIWVPGKKKKRK